MFRILICGSRDFNNVEMIKKVIDHIPKGTMIIHGACRGADTIADKLAREAGFVVKDYPANWKRYKRGAGPIRNKEMIVKGKPDVVIAFYTNKKESKGTKNMVSQAMKEGIPVVEFENEKR